MEYVRSIDLAALLFQMRGRLHRIGVLPKPEGGALRPVARSY